MAYALPASLPECALGVDANSGRCSESLPSFISPKVILELDAVVCSP